jgi:Domain of unknown function (DUF1833)
VRAFSAQAILSLNALQTGSAWWVLTQISHAELTTPYRFVNNTTDVTALGQTWTAFPFDITFPVDDGATQPSVEVRFDNVDRTLIDVVRGLASAPRFDLYLVLSTQPDVIEMSYTDMQMIDITFDAQSITGRLISGDLLSAPYPADSYTPDQFPALFA